MTRKITPQELLHSLIGARSAADVAGPNEVRLLAELEKRVAGGLVGLHFDWRPAVRAMSREQLAGLVLDHLDMDVGSATPFAPRTSRPAVNIKDFVAGLSAA